MSLTHSTDRLSHTPNRLSHTAQTSLCNQRTRYLSCTCSSHGERACFGLRSMPTSWIECLISHRFLHGTSVATPAEESARTSARRSSPSQPVATCPPHSSPPPMRSSACWHELRCRSGFITQNHRWWARARLRHFYYDTTTTHFRSFRAQHAPACIAGAAASAQRSSPAARVPAPHGGAAQPFHRPQL